MPPDLEQSTTVARLAADEATAHRIIDLVTESYDPLAAVAGVSEDGPGRWAVAIHFRDPPNETAVRALVALSAGPDAANKLWFETTTPQDWVKASHEGLKPIEAGRFVVHTPHYRGHAPLNRIAIEIEAALAFGTGHHGTTRGCLLALDRIVKSRRPTERPLTPARRALCEFSTSAPAPACSPSRPRARCDARVLASDIDPRRGAKPRAPMRASTARRAWSSSCRRTASAPGESPRAPFDLIFANILLGPLQRLAAPIARNRRARCTRRAVGTVAGAGERGARRLRARGLRLERRIAARRLDDAGAGQPRGPAPRALPAPLRS